MKNSSFGLLLSAWIAFGWVAAATAQTWTNTFLAPEQRADALLAAMTLNDKIAMAHAVSGPYCGTIGGNARLGIPTLLMQDGPAGVADGVTGVTAFPAPLAIGASWDVALARAYGTCLAQEQRAKGVNVMLGPMMNMSRVPQDGRNFEGYGEDPYLSGAMAAAEVASIQEQQVIANIKHFVGYEQETDRGQASADIGEAPWDDRTLQELYYAPFLACARAGAGSAMGSYNRLHLRFACESEQLNATLKKRWGFDGFVITDWGAGFSTVGGANNGLDVEMYSSGWFNTNDLTTAIQTGLVPQADLDGMTRRVLAAMFRFGVFDSPASGTLGSVVTNANHTLFARTAAAESMVLLQNTGGLLPLDPTTVHSMAIIGSVAGTAPISTGGGSAGVALPYNITPLAGISNRAGARISISYAQGDGASTTEAATVAGNADVAIVCVGQQTAEGSDRTSLLLPNNQDALIEAVAAANPNTIVVLYASGATLMPWANQVDGIVVAWYPGQENGNALASILFGDVNPSGKLPVTFPVASNQVSCSTPAQFPGINGHISYPEGLQIGYRWYDASNVSPLFPFGHGLSFTTFGYSNLTVGAPSPAGRVQVGFDLTNSGGRAGAEVAQLYLGYPAAANEPSKLLKGFQKTLLAAGQTQHVTFNLNWEDLANWSEVARGWVVTPGVFQVMVGASSRDLRLSGSFLAGAIPASDLANTALHRQVTVSSILATNAAGSAAVDGDSVTAWTSLASDPQWITVDLGVIKDLSRVRLLWNTNYASSYQIQISLDNTNWVEGFGTNDDVGGTEDVLVSGRGRYVRIYGTQQGLHGLGYSLCELQVYALPQQPWGGNVPVLPGVIQAENYDIGGEGVAYYNTVVGNSGGAYRSDDVGIEATGDSRGGYDVGWINTGEWWEYTVNAPDSEAIYSISVRVASPATGGRLRVRLGGAVLGTISIPNTGGWQNWQTVWLPNVPVAGGSGSQVLRLEALSGGFNLNWIALNRAAFCGTNNIALNQPVSCSSIQSASYPAASAVDGDPRTRWSSQFSDPQWITVDLGTNCNLARLRLNWEVALAANYQVQLSPDNLVWSNAYVTTNNLEILNDLAISGSGRYVRVYAIRRGTSFGDSLWDFEAYPALNPCWLLQPASQNTALGNTVTLSAAAAADRPVTYQWYHESNPIPGATAASLVLANVGAYAEGNYWVMASTDAGAISSSVAQVVLHSALPGIVATDAATNYPAQNPWSAGQNGGYGFGPWVFGVTGNTGGGNLITGSPLAFDIWDFTSLAASTASRSFNAPLVVGEAFSVQLKNTHLDQTNLYNRLELQAANGNVLFDLYWQGPNNTMVSADAHFTDACGRGAATNFTFNANNFSTYTFTLNSATNYTCTDNTTGASIDGILSGGPITLVTFARTNEGTNSVPNDGQDFQFNNLTLAASPISAPISLAPLAQGWAMSFGVAPGYSYRVQRAANLIGPWADIGTLIGVVSGVSEFLDTNAPTGNSFYRTVTP